MCVVAVAADADADDICDDVAIVWVLTIGVCNGDNTSCLVSGCTDASACNYNSEATVDDGSCESESCAGCDGVPFSGVTLDDCGVCGGDNSSCTGCLDEAACNYDADATIQGMVLGTSGTIAIEYTNYGAYYGEKQWEILGTDISFQGVFAGVAEELPAGTSPSLPLTPETDGYSVDHHGWPLATPSMSPLLWIQILSTSR